MGIFDIFRKKEAPGGETPGATAGTCCVCGKRLHRHPDDAPSLDEAARYCTSCGTDICVFCLQKLEGSGQKTCPVCGERVIFEINPLFRPD